MTDTERIGKTDSGTITQRLQTAGYEVHVSKDGQQIHVWTHGKQTLVGFFTWSKQYSGWQLSAVQPIIRTGIDLANACDDIQVTMQARSAIEQAWKEYTKTRTQPKWQVYLGTLAAYTRFLQVDSRPAVEEAPQPIEIDEDCPF